MNRSEEQVPPSGNGGIATLRIDPDAETAPSLAAAVSAQQEDEFFRNAGTEFHLKHHQQNLGWLGKFFGSNGASSPAATNIAGLVVCLSFGILVVSAFFSSTPELVEMRKLLVGLISTALAFIFGAATHK